MELEEKITKKSVNGQKEFSILYVDDEDANLRVFSHSFKRDYNVFTALDGLEALKIVKTNKIDLVITDQQMPIMSGVDLLSKIAEIDPNIARMIITGFSDIGAIIRAVNEFGLDKYLKKPWNKQLLKKEFDHVLKTKSQGAKVQNGNTNHALDTVILQNEEELKKYFDRSIILHDSNTNNQNSYWFGQNSEATLAAVFNGSKFQDSFSLNHFFHLILFEIIYKEKLNTLNSIVERMNDKLELLLKQCGDTTANNNESTLEASIILVNKAKNEIQVTGLNQNIYYYDDEGYFQTINGQKTNSLKEAEIKILPVSGVNELYLFSNKMQLEVNKNEAGVSKISYIETLLNSIHNMPFDAQSKLISRKLKDFNEKCLLAVRF